ncbi:hypothetical protein AA106555_0721 [Neokomagataea thailandica NBRC 106555]|uniref:SCO family protein n=2 Tax=Neokomagataea TaxID=1223423 RepID=A0A4Y6VA29_9PROT|nr:MULTISPECIES: SCO family protein [Neokomagataea]QDH25346.1 SCO family protein [Neokomagataea tanensis]GBR51884.1 hypothetical protein AA106555_0721 [Neokomagataea thailandica NBRC 106555]
MSVYKAHLGKLIVAAALLLAALVGYGAFQMASHSGTGWLVQSNGNAVGGSFRLVSLGESTVSEGDFHGRWLLVWFYDARTPLHIGRPVLASLEATRNALEAKGLPVTVIAVSLDPNIETDVAKAYVLPIAPHVMPLTGTQNMIRAMTALYHAPYKMEDGHFKQAPQVIVMDPKSHYAGMLDTSSDAATWIENIEHWAAR